LHDPATLARLRATWASYRAHLKMANSHRLWETLVSRCDWVRPFFALEAGLLVPRMKIVPVFQRLTNQYRFFADRFPECVPFFQVGCFFEFYDEQAERSSRLLGLTLLTLRLPLCVVRETDESLGVVKARRVAEYWQPIEADASWRTVMTHAG
jgi:hypothetical protein